MGRRKKNKSPLGFLANTNKSTILNIIGFFILAAGVISLVSFFILMSGSEDGRILYLVNQYLVDLFGWVSIFVPFILLLVSGHFFNTDKLKFVKPNISIGLLFIFFALLGFFGTGSIGSRIYESLTLDFSQIGAFVIFTIAFLIGIILFFDTSIDVFFMTILNGFNTLFESSKGFVIGKKDKDEKKEEDPKKRFDFISDKKPAEPAPVTHQPNPSTVVVPAKKDIEIKPVKGANSSTWVYPPLTLLHDIKQGDADRGDIAKNADIIERTLDSFGIRARVAELNKGPTVTQYALEITMGTKLSKITALGNDLALALAAPTGAVRIEAPIPGRSLVGVEIPNIRSQMVTLKQMLQSQDAFGNINDPLTVPLGLDVSGRPLSASIAKMPHVLIAGTTGSGKSVMLNAWLATLLCRTRPDEVRLILVDPKRVELALYNGIPHLLTEVIVEPSKIISALQWTVAEMENRNKQFAEVGVRNIQGYNQIEGIEKKPFIVFVIDELADLMMVASKDAEELITRIAQMARATGIHLVLATQRPSVDVITGLMKANIPTRLAFNVSSMVDSRVIIDGPGAEKLLGKGDMLYLPPDQAKPKRMQGAFVDDKEVAAIVGFLKSQVPEVHYTEEITSNAAALAAGGRPGASGGGGEGTDPLFNEAVQIIASFDKASASLLQRRLKVGYARAARILDELEAAGYVGPAEGSKPREVVSRGGAVGGGEE